MFYIKLENDLSLVITQREPIYRGEHLAQKIIYLIPETIHEIDTLSAYIYLNYIRADGVADVVVLERAGEKYNDTYYQYTFPVNCKLSKYPGEICTWMQIYTGSSEHPKVAKSGECILYVQESKNMDDYLCDHHLTALYQLHKSMEEDMAEISEDISKKADNISYNEDTRELQLRSGDENIGNTVKVPSDDYKSPDSEDGGSWSGMTDDDESGNSEEWIPM